MIGDNREGIGKILVVGNSPFSKNAGVLLSQAGYLVRSAGCSSEALERLSEEVFWLLLTELEMVGMDGAALTEAIRRCEEGTDQHLQVVGLTGQPSEGDQEKCLAAGMDAFFDNPADGQDLLQKIKRWLPPLGPAAKD